jgi:hypothetical protein
MKTIGSVLIALPALAGIAAQASAWGSLDRERF